MITRTAIRIKVEEIVSPYLDPAIPVTIFEIIQISFIMISFFFKNNIPVSQTVFFIYNKIDQVIKQIQDIKWEYQ